MNNQETLEFISRVEELSGFIQSTNKRMKKIYKKSWADIDVFWQEVWEELKKDPAAVVENLVADKLKKD